MDDFDHSSSLAHVQRLVRGKIERDKEGIISCGVGPCADCAALATKIRALGFWLFETSRAESFGVAPCKHCGDEFCLACARIEVGFTACDYCGLVECNFDCDDSQMQMVEHE